MNLNLKDKKVFISGSTKGIGFETARLFLKEGAKVIINGRTNKSVQDALSLLNNDKVKELYLGISKKGRKNFRDVLKEESLNKKTN